MEGAGAGGLMIPEIIISRTRTHSRGCAVKGCVSLQKISVCYGWTGKHMIFHLHILSWAPTAEQPAQCCHVAAEEDEIKLVKRWETCGACTGAPSKLLRVFSQIKRDVCRKRGQKAPLPVMEPGNLNSQTPALTPKSQRDSKPESSCE